MGDQLTHWAQLERALAAPSFSGKSGLSQLSLVTRTALTHTDEPTQSVLLAVHESFCINKASVLTAFTSHHTQDTMVERQNISNLSNSEQPIAGQIKQSVKSV